VVATNARPLLPQLWSALSGTECVSDASFQFDALLEQSGEPETAEQHSGSCLSTFAKRIGGENESAEA
jgi:hypothetical protein